MAWRGFDGIQFSFKSKEFSRKKNSSNAKVKADALWEEEQDRLIYRDWNRKCGLE